MNNILEINSICLNSNHTNQTQQQSEQQQQSELNSSTEQLSCSSFAFMEISSSSSSSSLSSLVDLFSFLIKKQAVLAEMGFGLAISHKMVLSNPNTTHDVTGHNTTTGHQTTTTTGHQDASFIYLFDLLHRKRLENQHSVLNNVIPKKYLDNLAFRYDVLDLSFKSAGSGGVASSTSKSNDSVSISMSPGENTNASDPEADRYTFLLLYQGISLSYYAILPILSSRHSAKLLCRACERSASFYYYSFDSLRLGSRKNLVCKADNTPITNQQQRHQLQISNNQTNTC